MCTPINQKEYLKKYLSGEKMKKSKKKKKEKLGSHKKGFKIIDDCSDLSGIPFRCEEEDEAPTIAEITYEDEKLKQIDQFKAGNKWKNLESDTTLNKNRSRNFTEFTTNDIPLQTKKSSNVQNDADEIAKQYVKGSEINKTRKDSFQFEIDTLNKTVSHSRNKECFVTNPTSGTILKSDASPPSRKRHDSDASPSRRERNDSVDSDLRRKRHDSDASPHSRKRHDSNVSPPRRKRHYSDASPRRKRHDSSASPHGKKRHNSDASPPRRKRHDSDISPPKRKRHDSDISPPKRKRHDTDVSPPRRKRHDSDVSPLRRKRHDSNVSPPRRKRHDSDVSSPRRRKHNSDASPRRKRHDSSASPHGRKRHDSDASPPRKSKHDSDISPSRRNRHDSDASPPRKSEQDIDHTFQRKNNSNEFEEPNLNVSSQRPEKNMTAADYLKARKFGKLKKDTPEDLKRMEREADLQKQANLMHKKWNKGVLQGQRHEQKVAEYVHEVGKSFARKADDIDMNDQLKNKMREEDPMLEYIMKKKVKEDKSQKFPIYQGSFPPNRFNIRPGYRWDGVDRSTGYEKEWFNRQNSKRATDEEVYKWSIEDM